MEQSHDILARDIQIRILKDKFDYIDWVSLDKKQFNIRYKNEDSRTTTVLCKDEDEVLKKSQENVTWRKGYDGELYTDRQVFYSLFPSPEQTKEIQFIISRVEERNNQEETIRNLGYSKI